MMEDTPEGSNSISDTLVNLASHLVVSLMMACTMLTFVQVGKAVFPGWDGSYLVLIGFLISMESMYVRKIMKTRRINFPSTEWILLRGAEWVVILIVLKIALYLVNGFGQFGIDILAWRESFIQNFFSAEYLFGIIVIFLIWMLSSVYGEHLAELEGNVEKLRIERESGIANERVEARQRILNLTFFVGGFMVLGTALLRENLNLVWFTSPALRTGVFNVLAFFVLGLILLSLAQFSIVRARLRLNQIRFSRDLPFKWAIYSFVFLSLIVIFAAILPTQYSVGFLNLLGTMIGVLFTILAFVQFLLLLPFFAMISLLAGLMGKPSPELTSPTLPKLPQPPPQSGNPVAWMEVVKSLLFWGLFLGIVGFAFFYYLRLHRENLRLLRRLPVSRLWADFWHWLRKRFGGIKREVAASLSAGLNRLRRRTLKTIGEKPWQYFNLKGLKPREQVLFYYLAMVRRGSEIGMPRKPSQTPNEYANSLACNLHSKLSQMEADIQEENKLLSEDVAFLTSQFVQARYSLQEVSEEQTVQVKFYWERIRRAFRKFRN
jgi:hypothetical protein